MKRKSIARENLSKIKKSQLKCYQMVLYAIKNILPGKNVLKTLPSSSINNYINICNNSVLAKQQYWNSAKWNELK